jgi:hypothetical protein
VVTGQHLYILADSNSETNPIERASINKDGSLGAFSDVTGLSPVTSRVNSATVIIGNSVYITGGIGGTSSTSLNTIERAIINADGSLENFSLVDGTNLVTGRFGHAAIVVGSHVYVIGGARLNATSQVIELNSVERATINSDGSLGPFITVSGVALTNARRDHNVVFIGSYVYVFGGTNGGFERASIGSDDLLGAFSALPAVSLMTARSGPSAVIGNYLYALWGDGKIFVQVNNVDRATINADGSIDSFATIPDITLTRVRASFATTVLGNYVHILGGIGTDASGFPDFLNSIETGELK